MTSGTHFQCFFCPWGSSQFPQSREGPFSRQGAGVSDISQGGLYALELQKKRSSAVTQR